MTCTCGNTFTTRSTAKNGVIHADVCSACHPFYTGKQKILDTGGRVARFEKRFGKKAADLQVAPSTAPSADLRGGAVRVSRRRPTDHQPPGAHRCSSSVADLVAEYADLERRLADPAVHADQAAARTARAAVRRARADRATLPAAGGRPAGTSGRPTSWPREDAVVRRRGRSR